jgi:hypothetical protein
MHFEIGDKRIYNVRVKRLLSVGIALTITHFSLSLYVSYKIGGIAGRTCAQFLTIDTDRPTQIDQLYQEKKQQFYFESKPWYLVAYATSVPLGPVTAPLWRKLYRSEILDPLVKKEKSVPEIKRLLNILHILSVSQSLLNSILFSSCILGFWLILVRCSKRD